MPAELGVFMNFQEKNYPSDPQCRSHCVPLTQLGSSQMSTAGGVVKKAFIAARDANNLMWASLCRGLPWIDAGWLQVWTRQLAAVSQSSF